MYGSVSSVIPVGLARTKRTDRVTILSRIGAELGGAGGLKGGQGIL